VAGRGESRPFFAGSGGRNPLLDTADMYSDVRSEDLRRALKDFVAPTESSSPKGLQHDGRRPNREGSRANTSPRHRRTACGALARITSIFTRLTASIPHPDRRNTAPWTISCAPDKVLNSALPACTVSIRQNARPLRTSTGLARFVSRQESITIGVVSGRRARDASAVVPHEEGTVSFPGARWLRVLDRAIATRRISARIRAPRRTDYLPEDVLPAIRFRGRWWTRLRRSPGSGESITRSRNAGYLQQQGRDRADRRRQAR